MKTNPSTSVLLRLFGAALLLLASCQIPLGRTTAIVVAFPGSPGRSVSPGNEALVAVGWSLKATGPGGKVLEYPDNEPGQVLTLKGIPEGPWSLEVSAYNTDGVVCYTAQGSVVAVSGTVANAVLYLQYSTQGLGTLGLTVSLPAGTTGVNLSATIDDGLSSASTAVLVDGVTTNLTLPAGFHTVTILAEDGSSIWWSGVQSFLLQRDQTTFNTVFLADSSATDHFQLSHNTISTGLPFDVKLKVSSDGSLTTATAQFIGSGSLVVEGPVTYDWYANGALVADEYGATYSAPTTANPVTFSVVAHGRRASASATKDFYPGNADTVYYPLALMSDGNGYKPDNVSYDVGTARGRFWKIQPNARGEGWVVLGNTGEPGGAFLTKLGTDGGLDPTFGTDGIIYGLSADWAQGPNYFGNTLSFLQQESADRYIVNEYVNNGVGNAAYLIRDYEGDVVFDPAGHDGNVLPASAMAKLIGSDQFYVVDYEELEPPLYLRVYRLNADGTVDGGFSSTSYAAFTTERPAFLATDPSGRLVAAGEFGTISRWQTNGDLDTTFGSEGTTTLTPGGKSLTVTGMKRDPSTGGYIVIGRTSSEGCVVWLTADGQLNTAYNGTGMVVTTYVTLHDLAPDGTGGVYIVGDTETNETTTNEGYIERYDASGAYDATVGELMYAGAYGSGARGVAYDGATLIVAGFLKLDATINGRATEPVVWRM